MFITHISSQTDKQEYNMLYDFFISLRKILEALIDYFYKEIDEIKSKVVL